MLFYITLNEIKESFILLNNFSGLFLAGKSDAAESKYAFIIRLFF